MGTISYLCNFAIGEYKQVLEAIVLKNNLTGVLDIDFRSTLDVTFNDLNGQASN